MKHLSRGLVAVVLGLSLSFSVFASEHHKEAPSQTVASSTLSQQSVINLNTADAKAIEDAHLKGIGKKRAEDIVTYREKHGLYKSPEDLKNIHGISDKIIAANQDRLTVG